jgi:hypothetical protein
LLLTLQKLEKRTIDVQAKVVSNENNAWTAKTHPRQPAIHGRRG